MARQNPPVLLPLERGCITRKHPLSSVSGRKRYNTLDFSEKVVCHETSGFIRFFLPRRVLPSFGFLPPRQRCRLWKPLPTGTPSPLDSPANRALSPLLDDPSHTSHRAGVQMRSRHYRRAAHCKGDSHPLWTPLFSVQVGPQIVRSKFPAMP